MTYLTALSLVVSLLALVVTVRTAMLNYKLRAEGIRREMNAQIQLNVARIEKARALLEYANAFLGHARGFPLSELPSLGEMETSLKSLSAEHLARSDSEIIGMRGPDFARLSSIQESLLEVEHRLDALRIMGANVAR